MNKIDHSKSTSQPNKDSSSSGEGNRNAHSKTVYSSKLIKIISSAIFVISLIVIYVLANRNVHDNNLEIVSTPIKADQAVEVEIVDGVGNSKVTQYATNVIRALGYDVVELKKSNEGIVERSYVLDRSGNMEVARKLALYLGIPKDKVFQKIDHNLYLDITVVMGKDYSNLKVFQSFNKRNKR